MPIVPSNSKCAHLGCKNTRSPINVYCMEHGGKETRRYVADDKRKENNSMYATRQWQSLRARQLSKQPICQSCFTRGVITQANHVDHVFPWTHIGKQAFYQNLFQSLCHECHSHKTGLEKRGVYRHYTSVIHDFSPRDYNRVCGLPIAET